MEFHVLGDGRPLAMLGGGVTGIRGLQLHAELLAHSRKVIRLQSLNVEYGSKSLPLPEDYTIKSESRLMKATLERLGLSGPLDIIGWSLGGLISLDFALDNPGLVRSLVLIEPAAFWVIDQCEEASEDLSELKSFFRSFDGVVTRQQVEKFRASLGDLPGRTEREDYIMQVWMQYRQSLLNLPAIADHSDDTGRLRVFPRPVLVVNGTKSMLLYRHINQALATLLPDVRRIELPGGHASTFESIEMFLEALDSFYADER
jgi:pimeloyl-ACP methyl ester carboxylesterase